MRSANGASLLSKSAALDAASLATDDRIGCSAQALQISPETSFCPCLPNIASVRILQHISARGNLEVECAGLNLAIGFHISERKASLI